MNSIKKLYTSVKKCHSRLDGLVKNLVNELKPSIDFSDDPFYDEFDSEISIFYQPSDGWVLEYHGYNASLFACIYTIEMDGKLNYEQFKKYSI